MELFVVEFKELLVTTDFVDLNLYTCPLTDKIMNMAKIRVIIFFILVVFS